mmetsp:Transcript_100702/g.291070  ORF Transcript_100702/g.291070 Transcript_100702/m.291070 type:complete len:479 (+) Transcript_100702:704-2140(+)
MQDPGWQALQGRVRSEPRTASGAAAGGRGDHLPFPGAHGCPDPPLSHTRRRARGSQLGLHLRDLRAAREEGDHRSEEGALDPLRRRRRTDAGAGAGCLGRGALGMASAHALRGGHPPARHSRRGPRGRHRPGSFVLGAVHLVLGSCCQAATRRSSPWGRRPPRVPTRHAVLPQEPHSLPRIRTPLAGRRERAAGGQHSGAASSPARCSPAHICARGRDPGLRCRRCWLAGPSARAGACTGASNSPGSSHSSSPGSRRRCARRPRRPSCSESGFARAAAPSGRSADRLAKLAPGLGPGCGRRGGPRALPRRPRVVGSGSEALRARGGNARRLGRGESGGLLSLRHGLRHLGPRLSPGGRPDSGLVFHGRRCGGAAGAAGCRRSCGSASLFIGRCAAFVGPSGAVCGDPLQRGRTAGAAGCTSRSRGRPWSGGGFWGRHDLAVAEHGLRSGGHCRGSAAQRWRVGCGLGLAPREGVLRRQ